MPHVPQQLQSYQNTLHPIHCCGTPPDGLHVVHYHQPTGVTYHAVWNSLHRLTCFQHQYAVYYELQTKSTCHLNAVMYMNTSIYLFSSTVLLPLYYRKILTNINNITLFLVCYGCLNKEYYIK